MAGSFDTVRAALLALLQRTDAQAALLPPYVLPETPKPSETPNPSETPASTSTPGETSGNGGNSGNGGTEDLFSTTIAPVPGEGPVSLPADETPASSTVETEKPADSTAAQPSEPSQSAQSAQSAQPSDSATPEVVSSRAGRFI